MLSKKKQIYYLALHYKITPAMQATKNINLMVNISLHYLPHLDSFFCWNVHFQKNIHTQKFPGGWGILEDQKI